jgi:hypothetical protein
MKRIEGLNGLVWYRYTSLHGEEYGPYYLRDRITIIGSVIQCVGDKSHLWHTWVCPRAWLTPHQREDKLSCYAGSKERAMYFVESWARHHYRREVG